MLSEVAARKRNAQSSLTTSRPAPKRMRVDWDAPRVDEEQPRIQLPPDDASRTRTHQVLTKCAGKLQVAVNGIQADRDRLSQRWEADAALRSQTVTDYMADLNSHFFEAETTLQDAISIVEHKLLGEARL